MDDKIEINGILLPSQWDADHRVVQMSLNAEDETVYLIEPNQQVEQLTQHLKKRVKLSGTLRVDPSGQAVVKVDQVIALPWLSFTQ